jgi:putative ATP-dependent endonuclease of OLD family
MKISEMKIRNYRTLETIDLAFPSSYSAICGANDSGKTNVVRAVRTLVKGGDPEYRYLFPGEEGFSLKDDYPKWKDAEPVKREISIDLRISLDRIRDAGFYQFVVKQLSVDDNPDPLDLSISVKFGADKSGSTVVVTAAGNDYSGLDAEEVLKKLQSSRSILFHNSTGTDPRLIYSGRNIAGYIREITGQHESLVVSMKKMVNRGLAKISRSQQAEFEALLGRLQTKYRVGLSLPAFDLGYFPFSITLGDTKCVVPLDDWGSGTRNRTLVLLALFRARQIGTSEPSAAKITPVIIIEEPESFLHPAAQAEFGRILLDLAEEFQVQVIVTTHSPYLLNLKDPGSNVLLRRRTVYRQLRDTERVDTSGDNWMAPFGQILGLNADEFRSWKPMMMNGSEAILLVEGDTDKEYFEMLRESAHGANRLQINGDIVPYGGTGSLSNTVLLRFIKNRFRRLFVTFDLDASERVEQTLQGLELVRGKHYLPIGINAAGKKNIEGLLPQSVTTAVHIANGDLVQTATFGEKKEQESARKRLKNLYLAEFKRQASPGEEYFAHFYALSKTINKALA